MNVSFILPPLQLMIVIGYLFIVAQGSYFHLAFGKTLRDIPIEHFLKLRKTVDPFIRNPLSVVYLGTAILLLLYIVIASGKTNSQISMLPVFSFVLLIADIITVNRLSSPFNHIVNDINGRRTYGAEKIQADWVNGLLVRGYLSIIGFIFFIMPDIFVGTLPTHIDLCLKDQVSLIDTCVISNGFSLFFFET